MAGIVDLLERDAFIAALDEYADEARAGQGRFILIEGEAGVGKTSLLDAFRERAADARWLEGACDGLFTPRPLGPVFDIAQDVGGELATACASGTREDVFAAVRATLADSSALTVLVVEDVHWADEATLDLLQFLARRVASLSAMIVVTYREDEVAPGSALRVTLGDIATQRSSRRIGLTVLSLKAVEALATGTRFEPGELRRLTGGNPFFLTEVLGGSSDSVPASARDAVMARAARLSPAGRSSLQAAALIGSHVEPWLLNVAAATSPDAIDECVSSGLLSVDGGVLRFRHEIARVALEQSIPAQQAIATHSRILDGLLSNDLDDHARLAHHAESAGDAAQVIEHAPEAARTAADLASHQEAAAQYQRVLRFSDHLDTRTNAQFYDALATELALVDRWEESTVAREEGLARWRSVGDRLRIGDDLRRLSVCMWRLCRGEDYLATAEAAFTELEALPPSPEFGWACLNRAQDLFVDGDTAGSDKLLSRAQELAEEFDLADLASSVLVTEGYREFERGEDGSAKLSRALDLAITKGTPDRAASAYVNLQESLTISRRLAEASRYYDDGIAFCDANDIATHGLCLRGGQAEALVHLGQFDAALVQCGDLLGRANASPINRMGPLTIHGLVLARQGKFDDAEKSLDESLANALGTGESEYIVPARLARAELRWLQGVAGCDDEVAAAREAVVSPNPWRRGHLATWCRRVGIDNTYDGAIAAPYARQLAGDHSGAAREWDELQCPYDAAMALLDSGDEALLREAFDRLTALGATATATMARRRLRAIGATAVPVGPRRTTSNHPLGLTRREQEVLELLCRDLGNGEIAHELVVSERTVEHHVSSILSKLDVPSRGLAAKRARDLDLVGRT